MSDTSDEINGLINELNNTVNQSKVCAAELDPLKKENMEKFVIESAGKLITDSLETISFVKQSVTTAIVPEEIDAFAGLINATSAALETLNKIIVVDKKAATILKAKEIEVASREKMKESANTGNTLLTREEVLRFLMNNVIAKAKIYDAEIIQESNPSLSDVDKLPPLLPSDKQLE